MKTTIDFATATRAMALMLGMTFVSAQSLAQGAPDMLVKHVRRQVLDIAKDNKGAGHARWQREAVAELMV